MKTAILGLVASAASLLGLAVPAADAASIPTSYTLTDLGPGIGSSQDDGLGTGFLHASDGRTFAFSWTNNRLTEDSIKNLLPPTLSSLLPANIPANNWFAYPPIGGAFYGVDGAFLNRQGVAVANFYIDGDGNYNYQNESETVVAMKREADGTFGPPSTLWGSSTTKAGQVPFDAVGVIDLNNNNLVLAGNSLNTPSSDQQFRLFDLNSGTSSVLPQSLAGWNAIVPIALDDKGQLFGWAQRTYSANGVVYGQDDYVLLTPSGLSGDPIATPEPTTLATFAVAAVGLLIRRRTQSR